MVTTHSTYLWDFSDMNGKSFDAIPQLMWFYSLFNKKIRFLSILHIRYFSLQFSDSLPCYFHSECFPSNFLSYLWSFAWKAPGDRPLLLPVLRLCGLIAVICGTYRIQYETIMKFNLLKWGPDIKIKSNWIHIFIG